MAESVPSRPLTGASDPDNEVTPAMVAAGVTVVRDCEYNLWESKTQSELSEFVLRFIWRCVIEYRCVDSV
jgi:hypothetical protein